MKNRNIRKVVTVVALLLLGANGVEARQRALLHDEKELQKADPGVVQDYLKIKNALVADEFGQARKAAVEMTGKYETYVKELKEPEAVLVTLNQFVTAPDLETQRSIFDQLSHLVYQSLKGRDNEKDLFLQSCPMALGGRGAKWLSLEEQVQNPYMGQRMPKCGSTIGKI